jgi:hypothetical protein
MKTPEEKALSSAKGYRTRLANELAHLQPESPEFAKVSAKLVAMDERIADLIVATTPPAPEPVVVAPAASKKPTASKPTAEDMEKIADIIVDFPVIVANRRLVDKATGSPIVWFEIRQKKDTNYYGGMEYYHCKTEKGDYRSFLPKDVLKRNILVD